MKRIAAVSLIVLATLASPVAGEIDPGPAGAPDGPRKNWRKQQPLPTAWDFSDVDMISVNEGWAVSHPVTGDSASLFHTTDGGKSWKAQGGLFRQLNGVSFIDAQHGVIVGNEVRYTLDGGATWLTGAPDTSGTLHDVEMVDSAVALPLQWARRDERDERGRGRRRELESAGHWPDPPSRPLTMP